MTFEKHASLAGAADSLLALNCVAPAGTAGQHAASLDNSPCRLAASEWFQHNQHVAAGFSRKPHKMYVQGTAVRVCAEVEIVNDLVPLP
jgi:hypothetical protein